MTYTLPGTDDKSRYVEQKFDEIAQKYDRFNDLITFGMHRYWKRFVVRQTGLHPEKHCLDLCCGTGDIAREVLRQYPTSRLTKTPPGFSTHKISCRHPFRFGTFRKPYPIVTASKFVSGKGISIASPSRY